MNPISFHYNESISIHYPEWLDERARCKDDKTLCRVALTTITSILNNTHQYAPSRFTKREYYPIELPKPTAWVEAYGPDVDARIVGSLGISADIGLFIKYILMNDAYFSLTLANLSRTFVVWGFPIGDSGHQIVVDAGFIALANKDDDGVYPRYAERYLVGGMTDYSGEGGKAAKQMIAVLLFLAKIYEVPIEFRLGTEADYEDLSTCVWNALSKGTDDGDS